MNLHKYNIPYFSQKNSSTYEFINVTLLISFICLCVYIMKCYPYAQISKYYGSDISCAKILILLSYIVCYIIYNAHILLLPEINILVVYKMFSWQLIIHHVHFIIFDMYYTLIMTIINYVINAFTTLVYLNGNKIDNMRDTISDTIYNTFNEYEYLIDEMSQLHHTINDDDDSIMNVTFVVNGTLYKLCARFSYTPSIKLYPLSIKLYLSDCYGIIDCIDEINFVSGEVTYVDNVKDRVNSIVGYCVGSSI